MDNPDTQNLTIRELIGQAVLNHKHELLGHIADAEVVPKDGRLSYIELLLDGTQGARSVFVPWSQLRFGPGGRQICAPFSHAFLRSISRPRPKTS